MNAASARPQSLQLIRLALMAGVLLFGAVILIVHRQPSWTPRPLPSAMDYALIACAIGAVSVAVLLKGRVTRESDPERRASLLIVGWSLGESAGLFGAVIFFITGQGQWYAFGLLAMACAFVLLPIGTRPDAARLKTHQG